VGSGIIPGKIETQRIRKTEMLSYKKSLYGVDIDLGAVEIAKLRLWLSLIVDEENIKDIKPLPNLDYKIMQGNSLIEYITPETLAKTADPIRTILIDQFNQAKQEYLSTYESGQKKGKRDEINKLIEDIMIYDKKRQIAKDKLWIKYQEKQQANLFGEDNKQLAFGGLSEKEKEKLNQQIEEFNQLKSLSPIDHFEWHLNYNEVFDEKSGFDVVIANPPYIGEKNSKDVFRQIKKGNLKNFYQSKMDIFYFFYHLALNLVKNLGQISFITTNYFLTATGAKKLRLDFKNRALIYELINFNELRIFQSAQGQHNIVSIISKNSNKKFIAKTCVTKKTGYASLIDFQNILNWDDSQSDYYQLSQENLYEGEECFIRINETTKTGSKLQLLLSKMVKNSKPLVDLCEINSGCDITISRITDKHLQKFHGGFSKNDGVFVLSAKELKSLKINESEKLIIKDFIKNSNVFKYYITLSNEKLIYLKNKDDIEKYPNIKNYLLKFKKILQDQAKRYEEKYSWYALHRPRKEEIFTNKQKILVPFRNKTNTFGYYENPVFSSRDVFYITKKNDENIKFILSLLNSKLIYFWLYHKGKRKGETLELYYRPLSEIPIKKISEEEQKPFVELVDQILKITSAENYDPKNPPQEQKLLESKINQMVYKLYGLGDEEIKIVEDKI